MSELKKLTRLGSNSKQLAALLQAKAPKGHVLAYISPKEASILKSRGGSGKPHADTGILSFENEFDGDIGFGQDQYFPTDTGPAVPSPSNEQILSDINYAPSGRGLKYNALPTSLPTAGEQAAASYDPSVYQTSYTGPAGTSLTSPTRIDYGLGAVGAGGAPALNYGGQVASTPTAPVDTTKPTFAEKTEEYLSKPETLAKLGLGGLQAVLGARAARKATEQGQQSAKQMQDLAAPYQQAGANIQAAAQRGELSAAGQQSLQAAQAQAAQAVQNRGGVGAIQAAQNVEAFRQQLLQQQYDYGLKLSGIGDNIALGAIKTGLQADQYAQQLTNNYYSNIARALYGTSTPTTPTR